MKKRKKIITVAIDSPAAAGAGTQAKLIAKQYNLIYLDTGKIYRFIGKLKLQYPKKFNYLLIKKKIKNLKIKDLQNNNLLTNEVATSASIIAKDIKIRKIVQKIQQQIAYHPPAKFAGSVLDGRDIATVQVKDAMFKFYITANVRIRAMRRFKEYKKLKIKITYTQCLKTLIKRDFSDRHRKYGRLRKTKNSILINTNKLSKKACFSIIKRIMDRKLKA